jgi:hypothetical protein
MHKGDTAFVLKWSISFKTTNVVESVSFIIILTIAKQGHPSDDLSLNI